MPEQIGDSIVSAIQEVDLSSSKAKDEKQLEPDEESLLLEAESEGEEISIQAVIIDGDVGPIERRVDDLEGLVENDSRLNYINYEDLQGRISVDNVSSANSSSVDNLREFEISGKFLSFPKYFPQEDAILFLFSPETEYELNLEGEPIIEIGIDSNVLSQLSSSADANLVLGINGLLDSSLNTFADTNLIISVDGSLDGNLSEQANLSNIISFDSSIEQILSSSANLLVEIPIDGILKGKSIIDGSIELQTIVVGNIESDIKLNGEIKKLVLLNSNSLSNLNLSGDLYIPAGYGVEYGSSYGG